MPQFKYKALDVNQRVVDGQIAAKNRNEAAGTLNRLGYTPLVVTQIQEKYQIKGKMPLIDKVTFCRYMGSMLSSGLSLSEGLLVLKDEVKQPLMSRILNDMLYSLEQGQQLSAVFEKYPTVFEPFFLTLVRAGEVSGKLAEVFKYLETELHAEYNLKSKIKGALLYPAVVFAAMIGIGILMFFFVLPQIGKVFLNLKIPLPTFTKTMFSVSMWLSGHFVPIIISVMIFVTMAVFALQKDKVRRLIFRFAEIVPLVKNLVKKIDLARFNRIFSTLIRSAVPITEALEISLDSLSWPEYRAMSKSISDEIRKGKPLSEVLKNKKAFPPLMTQMVTAGEKTGQLDSSLNDLAAFYEQEVEEELKNLTQILEPVLMLLVGIAVGVMILSIIAPIYSVVGNFQQAAGMPNAAPPL